MPAHTQTYPANPDADQQAYIADLLNTQGVTSSTTTDGTVTILVPDPRPLDQQQASVIAQIDALIDAKIVGGFTFAGNLYQSDTSSISAIQSAAVVALGAIIAASPVGNLRWASDSVDFAWIDATNVPRPMDAQTMTAFAKAAAAAGQEVVLNGAVLKAAVRAAPDAATLDAIDITAGWPT